MAAAAAAVGRRRGPRRVERCARRSASLYSPPGGTDRMGMGVACFYYIVSKSIPARRTTRDFAVRASRLRLSLECVVFGLKL